MKNPFKRKKKTTLDKLEEDVDKARNYFQLSIKFRDRLKRLDQLYPGVINYVDIFISKIISLDYDVEMPKEFLCSCKLLGLRIKEVKKELTYSSKTDFYMRIEFEDELNEIECDDEPEWP